MKVLPNHVRHVVIELYEIDLYVVVGSVQYFAEFMHNEFGEDEVVDPKLAGRTMMWFGPGKLMIYIKRPRLKDISHECFHAALFIAEERSLHYTNEDHEPLAYLHGYLVEQVQATIAEARSWKKKSAPDKS
jgi:hypothetical protein